MSDALVATALPADATDAHEQALRGWFRGCEGVVVALSGGVDSSLLARLAREELGARMVAVTGVSASLSPRELADIRAFCEAHDISHEMVSTHEMERADYVANAPDRCFHCKSELFGQLDKVRIKRGFALVVEGTHAGDLEGHRPGHRAAQGLGVRSPLVELGLHKPAIRALARRWGLANAERPSQPCLSSRIAYGVEVTPERLSRVDRAEAWFKERGYGEVRVRLHDAVARVELPKSMWPRAIDEADLIHKHLKAIGFTWITLDLRELRSGSLLEILENKA